VLRSPESLPEPSAPISLKRRFASRVGVAPEGVPIVLSILAAGIVLAAAGFAVMGVIVMALGAALAAFFRDPERFIVASPDAVVSGADGRVCEIALGTLPGTRGTALFTRISVFMSPLDVHVNRAPVAGRVTALEHSKGEFRAAFRDAASEHNERNSIKIRDEHGGDHGVVQVAGYLARRIVCYVRPHQRVERGQRIGLIMFGSRVDHFLPRNYRVAVEVGGRVRAGETIIGEPLE
jgi:phosphatidylserine decarboxylase